MSPEDAHRIARQNYDDIAAAALASPDPADPMTREDPVRAALDELRRYVKTSRSHPYTFKSGILALLDAITALAASPADGKSTANDDKVSRAASPADGAGVDVERVHRITCTRLVEHEPGSDQPYLWPCTKFAREYAAVVTERTVCPRCGKHDIVTPKGRTSEHFDGGLGVCVKDGEPMPCAALEGAPIPDTAQPREESK